jgi:hydrogenase expression/formation protein HypC
MCFGLPMVVEATDGLTARARRGEEVRQVSLLLVGEVPVGAHVLTHLDTAVRRLEPDEADLLDRAVAGLEAASRGERPDFGFEDLVDREPQLPPHLEEQRRRRMEDDA